jgi:acetolactate synthase-1/2/3 large subunit
MVDIDKTEFKSFANVCIHTDCNEFIKQISDLKYSNKQWLDECIKLSQQFPLIEKSHKDEEFPNVSITHQKLSNRYRDNQIRNFKNLYGDEKSIS